GGCMRRLGLRCHDAIDEPLQVVSHVFGPEGDQGAEPLVVLREQRSRCFLKVGEVAGHKRHDPVRPVPEATGLLGSAPFPPRRLHQLAQRRPGARRLRIEPFPMARKKRHFPPDDAEPRPARTGALRWLFRLGRRRRPQPAALPGFTVRRRDGGPGLEPYPASGGGRRLWNRECGWLSAFLCCGWRWASWARWCRCFPACRSFG